MACLAGEWVGGGLLVFLDSIFFCLRYGSEGNGSVLQIPLPWGRCYFFSPVIALIIPVELLYFFHPCTYFSVYLSGGGGSVERRVGH